MSEQEGPTGEVERLRADVARYRGALQEIDAMKPEDYKMGQGHLTPAFREPNFRDAFAHVCRIVNRTLHGVDSPDGPSS